MPKIHDTLEFALALHRAGDLRQAGDLYRSILKQAPGEANALRLLGVIEFQIGHFDEAERLLSRATKRQPKSADANISLAGYCWSSGRASGRWLP